MPNSVLEVQVVRGSENMNIDIALAERPTQTDAAAPLEIPAEPEMLVEPENGPPLTDEQRAQLREELIELFENGARPDVQPLPQ